MFCYQKVIFWTGPASAKQGPAPHLQSHSQTRTTRLGSLGQSPMRDRDLHKARRYTGDKVPGLCSSTPGPGRARQTLGATGRGSQVLRIGPSPGSPEAAPSHPPSPALPAHHADGQAAQTRKECSRSSPGAVTSAAAVGARPPAAPRPSSRARGLRLPSRARPAGTQAAVGRVGRLQHRTCLLRHQPRLRSGLAPPAGRPRASGRVA